MYLSSFAVTCLVCIFKAKYQSIPACEDETEIYLRVFLIIPAIYNSPSQTSLEHVNNTRTVGWGRTQQLPHMAPWPGTAPGSGWHHTHALWKEPGVLEATVEGHWEEVGVYGGGSIEDVNIGYYNRTYGSIYSRTMKCCSYLKFSLRLDFRS